MIQTTQSSEVNGTQEVRSVESVLREALDKLKATVPKRFKELRDEVSADLERLDGAKAGGVNADNFFKSLKLSCEASGNPKVVSTALDSVHKLLHFGHLTGKDPDPFKESAPGGAQRCLIDSVIESICGCAEQADDAVQMHMIRALLTAVTSKSCEVHGNSLMLAVNTCFKIHRDSKSSMNQRTAHASLSQMLTVVTQRIEMSLPETSSGDTARKTNSVEEDPQGQAGSSEQEAKLVTSNPPKKLLNDWMTSYVAKLVDDVVLKHGQGGKEETTGAQDAAEGAAPGSAALQNLDIEASFPDLAGGVAGDVQAEGADHDAVDEADEDADQVVPVQLDVAEPKAMPLTPQRAGGERMKLEGVRQDSKASTLAAAAAVATATASGRSPAAPAGAANASQDLLADVLEASDRSLNPHHKDALLVFQFLCKMSMKDLPSGQADARVVRSKRMALELVQNMLQLCGPVCRSSEGFILILKRHLCLSLIKNSVSSIPKIFGHSLNIWVMLMSNFREHLRAEIGVFIEQIFLRILESGNSTFTHKHRVLQVFYKACTDARTALELFLNFDCDVDEKNIFERMIDCLSKIAQGKYTSVEHANLIQPHQELELKALALQALVHLMASIVGWADRLTQDQPGQHGDSLQKSESKKDPDSDAEDDAKSDATFTTSGGGVAPSSIVEQKQRKLELQIGVNKFNMKPKRGIEYLKQNGFVSDAPEAVAELFKRQDIGLDKTAIGDYLGEEKPFNKKVLYALVDAQDFTSLELDGALRSFLSIFRLPGEAQKIDRMMEKFAEKYCQDNPEKFANADCAFVLSFSLIMLQTDLNNPGVKNKMTKDEFVRNNRGINDSKDLPREYLEGLYTSIANNPISLQEDEDAKTRMDSQAAQGAAQKYELFVRETESIVLKSQEMMKQKISKQKNSAYITAQSVEHVRPLFEVACWPYLATLAVLLEMQDSASSVGQCIEGFQHCIRIAARFDMDTERDAFVSSLAKFTYLTTVKEMKPKNIECIKALLAIGLSEGNNLGPSWQYVLTCISQLQRLELIGNKFRQDFQFFQDVDEFSSNVGTSSGFPGQRSNSISNNQVIKRRAHGLGVSALVSLGQDDRQVELVNAESLVSQVDAAQIELLFNRSTNLNSKAIVDFVTQLARVSKEELALVDQPRIFSLQKLVEVADYNMNRIRLVWSRIWRVLSGHFIEVACHQNIRVSMYAIDSLRQLAMKFLEKDELSNYNFQADFLRPFEVVMVSSPGVSKDVKDLIVSIISNMVQGKIKNIKSGWKTVFHILHAAASEQQTEAITQCAFSIVERVIEHHYGDVFVENFSDGIRTLLAFGQSKAIKEMSLKAINYLLQAAEYLADKTTPDPPPPPQHAPFMGGVAPSEAIEAAGGASSSHPAAHWFPILRGLSMLVSDPRRDVRAAALNGVFDCLRDHGATVFDEDTWRMIFNGVIKPLFDDIHHQLAGDQRKPDGSTPGADSAAVALATSMGPPTCLLALTALVRLFEVHVDSLAFLLDDVLRLIESCIQHETEAVARIGVEGFKQLLLHTGKSLQPVSWQKVTASILQLFHDSTPSKLMCVEADVSGVGQLPFRKEVVVIQCVVQLMLIDMLQDAISQHYDHIPPDGIMTLLDALQRSYEFAQEFNQQIDLRQTLKRLGFMREMKQLPGLLKQEREALSCSLKVLFQVQSDARMQGSKHKAQAEERLMRLCKMVLRNFVDKEQQLQEQVDEGNNAVDEGTSREREAAVVEMEREVHGLVPIVSEVVLRGLKDLPGDQFARSGQELFPLLCELMIVNSREVRWMLREVLLAQVNPLLLARAAEVETAQALGGANAAVACSGEEKVAPPDDLS